METSIYYNEYIISSNNSINENTLNDQKFKRSPSYRLKKLLKPLMNIINNNKQSSNNNNKSSTTKLKATKRICKCKNYSYEDEDEQQQQQEDDYIYNYTYEIDNNQFNEELETRIITEIKSCDNNSAIYVFDDDENNCSMSPYSDEVYVPVHFARTQEGTFFWTTTQRIDDDLISSDQCESNRQLPQLQQVNTFDRWIQA